jgi:hypothetical protein
MDDATYKLVSTSKEIQEAKLRTSYQRGYECGNYSSVWFDNPPTIARSQVLKFHLDFDEYVRGFMEGFKDGKEGVPINGQREIEGDSTERREERS